MYFKLTFFSFSLDFLLIMPIFSVLFLNLIFFSLSLQDIFICKLSFMCNIFLEILKLVFNKVFFMIQSYFSKFKMHIEQVFLHYFL